MTQSHTSTSPLGLVLVLHEGETYVAELFLMGQNTAQVERPSLDPETGALRWDQVIVPLSAIKHIY